MFKDRWKSPTQNQLKYLKGISNGSLTWYVTHKDIANLLGETHEETDYREMAKLLCYEHIQQLKDSKVYYNGWIEIERPEEIEEGTWCVGVFATDNLLSVIDCLSRGVYWNMREQRPDFEKTEQEWRMYLKQGRVTDYIFELASRNHDPELRAVRAELVLFKLTAQRDAQGNWRNVHGIA